MGRIRAEEAKNIFESERIAEQKQSDGQKWSAAKKQSAEEAWKPAKKKRISKMALLRGVLFALAVAALIFLLKGTEYVLLILLAAAIHESGHIFFAKLLRVRLVKAEGGLLGVWLKYDFSDKSYLVQIIVSCAGAAFNVVACVVTMILFSGRGYGAVFFMFSNLALALFNLMPVSRFDGIGILRCLCLTLMKDADGAERICRAVSAFFSGAFFLLTVYIQMRVGTSLSMLIISVFLLYNCVGDKFLR